MAPPIWREIQKKNFTSLSSLAKVLNLDPKAIGSNSRFPINIPARLAEKIQNNTLNDPILRQFVPLPEENHSPLGFVSEPLEEKNFCKSSKLIQKYSGRALLVTTSACAMHCRYCFRQNFEYETEKGFDNEMSLIREDKTLHEVILSGGDPLSLSDQVLENLIIQLNAIDHLKLIRFHSRFLIGIPERVTKEFLEVLKKSNKQVVFVIHANHANEFDEDVFKALKKIQQLGIPLLHQAVLLKGVNDNIKALKNLCLLLSSHGILPYYLHQLDPVAGSSHFEVPKEVGIKLIEELRQSLPGYSVPLFVQEIPGNFSKMPLN